MKITFSLLKAPAKAALQQGQKSFDEQGGSIGRGESNTWALPDPDKFLSSKHCVVTFEQGQFYITDTSTNGLFLNGATLPVGRNNRVSVSEGDTLDLGEYRLRVGLEKSAAKISPFAEVSPAEPAPIFNAGAKWGELEASPPAADGADLFPIGGPGAGGDPFYDASMDPFAAKDPFGLAGQKPADLFPNTPSQAAPGNPFGADPFGGDPFGGPDPFTPQRQQATPTFTQNEGHNPMHDVISLPKVAPTQAGPATIPDDFWNSLGGAAAADELGMPSLKPLDPFASDDPLAPPAPFAPSPSPFAAPIAPAAPQQIPPRQPATPTQHTLPPQHTVPGQPAPPPPQPNLPVHPLESAPGPDMLGENPFAHIGQTPAGPTLAPDDIDGQLYPIGSAYSQQVPSVTPGKVPLSDRLKALQAGAEDADALPPWAEPIAPAPVIQTPPIAPTPPTAQVPPPHYAPPAHAQPAQPQPAQPRPAPPVAASAYAAETGVHNLVAALGLTGQLNGEQEQLLPQLIGEITREAISGLLQILRARNSIKNEFRIAVTTIQPRENNPIKFATDVDDALELLFVRASKGYKPPVESVQDSFESIMDHQVAILAGIRAAFKSLLTRFDPVHLEQQFERQGKTGGLLPGMKGAKCWSAYDDFYQDLIGNFENSFQNLFGDEFVQAYEEQLRKLAIARKREHSQR
jgi:type VI secretion system FHA domain protein